MTSSEKNNAATIWEDLVISVLAVNGYSVEKAYALSQSFRAEGLVEPTNLSRWSSQEIEHRLHRAGYTRGQFMTALFGLRLSALGVFLESRGLEGSLRLLQRADSREIEHFLLPVPVIGPKVLSNFFLLRGITASPALHRAP